jgi:hypothetical protein
VTVARTRSLDEIRRIAALADLLVTSLSSPKIPSGPDFAS